MRTAFRIIVEVFAPAFLGTILLFVWKKEEIAGTRGITPFSFFAYLMWAYAFTILPSVVYSFLMEIWLRRKALRKFGTAGVTTFSTILGAAAGGTVWLASEVPLRWIGVIVGLVLGLILSVSAPRYEKPA